MHGIYSVSQVNGYIKQLVSTDYALSRIAIKGEVSNVKYHSSGHIYFTLKDDKGALRCVMFASCRAGLSFTLQNGQSSVVLGRIDVYEKEGSYQLYANEITLDGAGILYQRLEELKSRLFEEGLFDFEHKKEIPKYVKTVGVVTAATGAAIRDIESIPARRNPYVQLYLYPALVQGEYAAASIVKGIQKLDKLHLDVIIVGRGGGSIEDLWPFNEECVARAIYAANTPIISGTGHETDTTIADYVADKRAATPSAACELAVFDYQEFVQRIEHYEQRIQSCVIRHYREKSQQLENYRLRLEQRSPKKQYESQQEYVTQTALKLTTLMHHKVAQYQNEAALKKQALLQIMPYKIRHYQQQLKLKTVTLHGLSPTAKLVNGYGYITKKNVAVKDIEKLQKDDIISITMASGSKKAQVL